ncbi:hypothetical protein GALMADRAFT_147076 [Galerina marginata CBS 339.88]|uniref:Uncharacterized protein n=1 Tax=Galerina marginata (strain CBS 339.88) TaxID=685588 RepID=A0A067S9L4_GALM3|nr:hypothetical protein GALMADRAFT_147076 [Galerina marginata CBS 339.88]
MSFPRLYIFHANVERISVSIILTSASLVLCTQLNSFVMPFTAITTLFFILVAGHAVRAALTPINAGVTRTLTARQSKVTFPTVCNTECRALIQAINCGSGNPCDCAIIEAAAKGCQACLVQQQAFENNESAINPSAAAAKIASEPQTTLTVPDGTQYQQCANVGSSGLTTNQNNNGNPVPASKSNGGGTSNGNTNSGGNTGGLGLTTKTSYGTVTADSLAYRAGLLMWICGVVVGSVLLL